MKLLDKILLSVLSVLTALIGALILVGVIWLPFDAGAVEALYNRLQQPLAALIVSAFALLLIGLAVGLMLSVFRKRAPKEVPIGQGEGGGTYLTLSALTAIVSRFLTTEGILNESRTTATVVGEGVEITIRIVVQPGMTLPVLTERLQSDVKAYLESYTGVRVERVSIIVEAQAAEPQKTPSRVS